MVGYGGAVTNNKIGASPRRGRRLNLVPGSVLVRADVGDCPAVKGYLKLCLDELLFIYVMSLSTAVHEQLDGMFVAKLLQQ